MTYTTFATTNNPFTGKAQYVSIPNIHPRKKGTTLHDDKFDSLIKFDKALVVHESDMGGMRKALHRYLTNKGLRKEVSMRQLKQPRTNLYQIWLVNVPPMTRKAKA